MQREAIRGTPAGAGAGAGAWLPVRERIAWLLRVNRIFGQDGQWARAGRFASAFQGGCWLGTASESKLSRWETAILQVPRPAIRRYEELLGLPAGLLVSAADTVSSYYAPVPGYRRSRAAGGQAAGVVPLERIETLVDRACRGDVMSGADWDELTAGIAAAPGLLLAPSSAWGVLAERLLAEQIVADGVAWLQRFEALGRLLAHPVAQRAAIAACASLAADPGNQVSIEVICALDGTGHPDASRHVLAQLASPTNDLTFYGALLACVRKVARGHFIPEQVTSIGTVLAGLVDNPARPGEAAMLAATLARQMPAEAPRGLARRLHMALARDAVLGGILSTGRLAPAGAAAEPIRRITSAAANRMPREAPWPHDNMLALLVDEMLYSPVSDIRLYAAVLANATPYRQPLAAALAAELARTVAAVRDTGLAERILDALRVVGGAAQRPIVEHLTLGRGLPPPLVAAAARNIGHLGGASPDAYWSRAITSHSQLWKRHGSAASEAVLRSLVYGLGIARNTAQLARVCDSSDIPVQARQAASWWLGQPRLIMRSASS